jgi:nondiscriminating aspartyl-tRNA synthetase
MERTLIKDLHTLVGKEVSISGSIEVRRDHGKLIFLVMRDRSGYVQSVVLPNHAGALEVAQTLRPEWVITLIGIVNQRPEKMVNSEEQNGAIELEAIFITVISRSEELPFSSDADLNLDTLFDYRPLTLRRKRERAIFKVQHEIMRAYRAFLTEQDFVEFQAPKLVGDDAEGGGNIFKLPYFGDSFAYLATSPQLYKQIMVGVFERVFTTGNVFRAEKHATTRHLNEYTSIDIEFGFITDHTDVMRLETALMRHILEHLKTTCAEEFKILEATLPQMPQDTDCFPHMKLRQAQALIKEKTGVDKTQEPDLEPEDERWLCEYAHAELGSDFIFITHYPVSKRPFYTYEDENDPGYTKSFDLLFRGVEITTGGQRVHTAEMMEKKLKDKGLDPKNFAFYLQAFRYGLPPHGGWGMGLERLTQKFLGLKNVKEAAVFPRDINRIDTLISNNLSNNHENNDNE